VPVLPGSEAFSYRVWKKSTWLMVKDALALVENGEKVPPLMKAAILGELDVW
jgi:hypothetical protein